MTVAELIEKLKEARRMVDEADGAFRTDPALRQKAGFAWRPTHESYLSLCDALDELLRVDG